MAAKKMAFGVLLLGVSLLLILALPRLEARSRAAAAAPPVVNRSSIGGAVISSKGPEAGVWVIAETKDLPTGFRKIVVTDDQGRYVVPDLPKGTYKVWVRGYGLVDSKPVNVTPGKTVNLQAVLAPSERAAAQYYPANYWYSMIKIPPKSAFPMEKEGINDQLDWITRMKFDIQITQVGDRATREIPEKLGKFKSSEEAWQAWLKVEPPVNVARLNKDTAIKMYADWTDRIAAGDYPKEVPPRPQGLERNVVISEWDWGNDKSFIHDVITTYNPDPSFNANGLIYGAEQFSSDNMVALDPVRAKTVRFAVPMRDQDMPSLGPQKYPLTWGNENIHPGRMRLHNQMFDLQGRIWTTAKFRKSDAASQPSFCKKGEENAYAKLYPITRNGDLQVVLYEPGSNKFQFIDTCFATHHMTFGEDADDTLYFSSAGSPVVGWIDTKVWDETHDPAKAQGWCPYILDTNGDGKQDSEYQVMNPHVLEFSSNYFRDSEKSTTDALAPQKDTLFNGIGYGIAYNPVDHSVWVGSSGNPGYIVRVETGSNPPRTCKAEVYFPPSGVTAPKGVYADRQTGLIWVSFAGSGQFASFDRRKCKVLNGPTATGHHCPEGWTLYPQPGPKFQGTSITADWYYLNWVDQFNALGLGNNVPMAPGTNSDSLIALKPDTKQWVVMRVPYPMGFYSRGMDGRIDDPNGGWKGRGLWTTYASVNPWNMEGGKGSEPKVVKFQVRPDPLAQ